MGQNMVQLKGFLLIEPSGNTYVPFSAELLPGQTLSIYFGNYMETGAHFVVETNDGAETEVIS